MKTLFKLTAICLLLISCGDFDEVTFDPNTGQTGLAFTSSAISIVVPPEGVSGSVDVEITTISSSDRNFSVSVDATSDAPVASYVIGTVTIPANSHAGTLTVDFNDTDLVDLVAYTLKINIDTPSGVVVTALNGDFVNFTVVKKLICNDYQLDILLDNWGSETTWDIKDATDTVVESGGPYTDGTAGTTQTANFTLADGCYTFTIYDAYADGLYDGTNTGTYSLDCSIVNQAFGSGNFGASEATAFCVND